MVCLKSYLCAVYVLAIVACATFVDVCPSSRNYLVFSYLYHILNLGRATSQFQKLVSVYVLHNPSLVLNPLFSFNLSP